jgi:ABC-type Fe3+-hydroxamate transport system substrate-binding protein
MLAVVSDGWYGSHIDPDQRLITTVARSGCAVLWLHPNDQEYCRTYTDATTVTVTVTNPVDAITVIADAAITALQRA